ncbi:unnamed protein product, partial [Lymnaea stagnalis]
MRTGRIHRQGGRIVHSRSPSVSPSVSPRPSYRRKKNHRDTSEHEETPARQSGHNTAGAELLSPTTTPHQDAQEDDGNLITEKNLRQRMAASEKRLTGTDATFLSSDSSSQKFPGSSMRSSGPLSPTSLEESRRDSDRTSKSAADSSVSFSSLDTVISPFGE